LMSPTGASNGLRAIEGFGGKNPSAWVEPVSSLRDPRIKSRGNNPEGIEGGSWPLDCRFASRDDGVDGLALTASSANVAAGAPPTGRPSVKSFIRIGVDLAKNAFQVHGFEHEGGEPARRKLSRAKFREFFFRLGPSRVGMEACGSAHYWARELTAMGHDVVLMPPTYIKPYVKRGKNDALDAAAVCEAMSRPDMRFVPVKSADQQAVLMVHKTRELIVKQRTMSGNALRSHLAEFGLIAPKGVGRVAELLALAEADATLAEAAKAEVKLLAAHLEDLDLLDRQFAAERPNPRWIADFTHIWTAEGWLYVAAVIDLFSPRVVGWSMKAEMTAQRVADALVMAIWRRGKPDALLHHSDQGSQYASEQFQRLMADNG